MIKIEDENKASAEKFRGIHVVLTNKTSKVLRKTRVIHCLFGKNIRSLVSQRRNESKKCEEKKTLIVLNCSKLFCVVLQVIFLFQIINFVRCKCVMK